MEITKAKTQLLPNGWILFKVGCTRRSNTYVGIYIYRSYLVICIYISFHHFCPVLFYFNVSFKEIAGYKKNQTNKQTKKKKKASPPSSSSYAHVDNIQDFIVLHFLVSTSSTASRLCKMDLNKLV